MAYERGRRDAELDPTLLDPSGSPSAGKLSLTSQIPARAGAVEDVPITGYGFLTGAIQRKAVAGGDDPFALHVQRKEHGNGAVSATASGAVTAASSSSGQPLPGDLRARFEQSLGADLGDVRVHDGAASAQAADALHARAYTTGRDIHFSAGAYNPGSDDGARLLAHEVAHTVQQRGASSVPQTKLAVSAPGDSLEHEADVAADAMMAGRPAQVTGGGAGIIARDTKPGQPAADAQVADGDEFTAPNFTITGGKPEAPGAVTPSKSDGKVRLESPLIQFSAQVAMKKPLTEGRIDIGPIQTLLGSSRVGVYREGGKPDGAIVAEQHTDLGQMRDAAGEIGKDGQLDQATVPPFYSQPQTFNKDMTSVSVNFKDKPKAVFPAVVGKGKLTETRGEDRFTTSISAKKDGALLHLKTFHWQLPWAMKLDDGIVQTDEKGNPTNKSIATQDAKPGDAVVVNDSNIPILAAAGATHMDFPSQDAANQCGASELLRFLPTATGASRGFIVEALKSKNPSFHVTVTVKKKNSSWGKDSIEMRFKGQSQISRPRVSAGDGESVAVLFTFNEVFTDPAAMKGGSFIMIEAQDRSLVDGKTHRADWQMPFAQLDGEMPGSDGTYTIVATMRG
ncbi:MAG TPA: DUF4157 domain-containing protein [Kofleriaceae bacterium]|nr:DUF4157 domain-containing protein [Kofleriaceae bacterium]